MMKRGCGQMNSYQPTNRYGLGFFYSYRSYNSINHSW